MTGDAMSQAQRVIADRTARHAGTLSDGYRGPQVCKIVGITYRCLDYWARTDLLRPSIADAHGQGSRRRYAYRDLVELKIIKAMLDAGMSLQSARRVIDYLRAEMGDDLASAILVISGNTATVARTDGEILDFMRRAPALLYSVLPVGRIVAELDADILLLRRPT